MKRQSKTATAAAIFRALGHPARLQIVRELAKGEEKCVCELVEKCGLSWSAVSRHLAVLRTAGILSEQKRGLQVFQRLALPCVARFLDCLEHPRSYPELQKPLVCCS